MKKYPKARATYQKVLKKWKNSQTAMIGLGKVYTLIENYQKGFFYYNKAHESYQHS